MTINPLLRRAVAVCLLTFAAGNSAAFAQSVVVAHAAEQAVAVDLGAIRQLPATEVKVAFETGHGSQQATFTGVLLWTLLDKQGALTGTDQKSRVRQTIAATGRDGYVAVLALGEIHPEFEGKQVILAYLQDGQPIANNELRLVVPGDRRGGRSVRDVVRIELR